ncbi:hypothetical protein ABZ559_08175 [Streptococcus sp. ZY19097]|uniref:hypothetical protein n=1 Tax=Streptococcus sp. ZY19097 TaxID=3231906 RepID=UPI00345AAF77
MSPLVKSHREINHLPTQHHLSIDNLSLIEHEVLSGTGITIVSQDIAERILANKDIVTSSQKFKDISTKTYAIIKMDNPHYQELISIIQKLKS